MIRIAAVGDVHVGTDVPGFVDVMPDHLVAAADALLLAGDLTQHGTRDEAVLLADELRTFDLPVIAVLGNHDYHQGQQENIRAELEAASVRVLEAEGIVLNISGIRVGIAGVKGFGGGFMGACGSDFGEEEMKNFVRHSKQRADRLKEALSNLHCDVKIALTHYAPVPGTLAGERLEIFPFLGSYMLGEAIDTSGCSMAFHGHAHAGTEHALTPGGVPVMNVARPVIKLAYKIYALDDEKLQFEEIKTNRKS